MTIQAAKKSAQQNKTNKSLPHFEPYNGDENASVQDVRHYKIVAGFPHHRTLSMPPADRFRPY